MFEEMDRASRFSSKAPEFLRTHPLTTNRIVDATNLARQHPKQVFPDNIDYTLVRARARWLSEKEPQLAIKHFRSELSGFSVDPHGSHYGLALALFADKQYQEANQTLSILERQLPNNHIVQLLRAEITVELGNPNKAITQLQTLVKQKKDYYPATSLLSQIYQKKQDYKQSVKLLHTLTEQRPDDPIFWYNLAETAGLAQDIANLHRARAEYFILLADFGNAKQQLKALVNLEKKGSLLYQYAETRLDELDQLERLSQL
jgi:predicted Zn-dependent protease